MVRWVSTVFNAGNPVCREGFGVAWEAALLGSHGSSPGQDEVRVCLCTPPPTGTKCVYPNWWLSSAVLKKSYFPFGLEIFAKKSGDGILVS